MSDTADTSVLRARGLRKHYGKGQGLVRAVDEVDLRVAYRRMPVIGRPLPSPAVLEGIQLLHVAGDDCIHDRLDRQIEELGRLVIGVAVRPAHELLPDETNVDRLLRHGSRSNELWLY